MAKIWGAALALGLGLVLGASGAGRADGFGAQVNVNFDADNAAHYDFNASHNPLLFHAAQNVRMAKQDLWNSPDHGPRRMHALQRLNQVLDWLGWTEAHPNHRPKGLKQALWHCREARRILASSAPGPAKRAAMGHVKAALGWIQQARAAH